MKNKNNRIIIKPGRTHTHTRVCVVCLSTLVSSTSYQLRVYSMVDDLTKRRRKKKREEK
jgi:hypothetical protein